MNARAVLVVCLALLPLARVGAQAVRVTARDASQSALAGVVITLLASDSSAVVSGITGDRGELLLQGRGAGLYRLKAIRIGFSPTYTAPFLLADGETGAQLLVMQSARVQLTTVRVVANGRCEQRNVKPVAEDSQLAMAWEQAAAAMTAASITSSRDLTATVQQVERTLDPSGRRVRAQTGRVYTETSRAPWRSESIDRLQRDGYIVVEGDSLSYYAPGLDVLTSPRFLEDHCLRLVAGRDASEIGVAFEPLDSRRDLPDVRGVVWLTRSAMLTRMEFNFTRLPAAVGRVTLGNRAGGHMSFIALPGGGVLIREWEMRMPAMVQRAPGARISFAEVYTGGARLLVLRRGADTVYRAP